MASFIKKGVNFARAYAKWALAGKPLRDDTYIADLFKICEGCPSKLYIRKTDTTGECDECGCHIKNVSATKDALNKLAWPTECCPWGHWDSDIDEPEGENLDGTTEPPN